MDPTLAIPTDPSSPRRPATTREPCASDGPRETRPRVLVVDDDDACRAYLAEAFGALGCRSAQAADAGEALRLLAEQRPDLVCSDLRMPGMDGLEFLDLLRAHAPDLPCVVVSGCGEPSALAEADRLGATAFLRKPVPLEELKQLLRLVEGNLGKRPVDLRSNDCIDGGAPSCCATPAAGLLNSPLLHKTTQLSLLTRFAAALRGTGGAHAADASDSSVAVAGAPLIQRGLEIAGRALGAEQATLCVMEDGRLRVVATHGVSTRPLPIVEAATHLRMEGGGESWHGVIGGVPVVAAPLVIQGEPVGVLCAGRDATDRPFAWSDAELLDAFAGQTAVALENASLGRQLEQAFQASVATLVVTLEAKHKYTEGHSLRVAEYAYGIATTLALPALMLERVRTAALLHDLGKVGVRDEILDKAHALTAEEWIAMRQHPLLGARILASLGFLAEEARIVRHHHERPDGRGYPDGLVGDAIPFAARIIAVADAYDAMRSARSYRPALPEDVALEELRRGSGTQFDAGAVTAFLAWRSSQASPGTPEFVRIL